MTPADREEALRTAAALLSCVTGEDAEGATVLVRHASRPVLEQAAADLARWLAACLDPDPATFRAELAEVQRRHALRAL